MTFKSHNISLNYIKLNFIYYQLGTISFQVIVDLHVIFFYNIIITSVPYFFIINMQKPVSLV